MRFTKVCSLLISSVFCYSLCTYSLLRARPRKIIFLWLTFFSNCCSFFPVCLSLFWLQHRQHVWVKVRTWKHLGINIITFNFWSVLCCNLALIRICLSSLICWFINNSQQTCNFSLIIKPNVEVLSDDTKRAQSALTFSSPFYTATPHYLGSVANSPQMVVHTERSISTLKTNRRVIHTESRRCGC